MQEYIANIINHYSHWFTYLASFSIALLVISIIIIPMIIARIPSDHFTASRQRHIIRQFTLKSLIVFSARNIFGLLMLFIGMIMLVVPGQGLLTILLAVIILDFPGKHKIERYLIKIPGVLSTLNWIRRKQNSPDFYIN